MSRVDGVDTIKEYSNVRAVNCGEMGWIRNELSVYGKEYQCSIDFRDETIDGAFHRFDVINIDKLSIQHDASTNFTKNEAFVIFFNKNKPKCRLIRYDHDIYDDYTLVCSKTGEWGRKDD